MWFSGRLLYFLGVLCVVLLMVQDGRPANDSTGKCITTGWSIQWQPPLEALSIRGSPGQGPPYQLRFPLFLPNCFPSIYSFPFPTLPSQDTEEEVLTPSGPFGSIYLLFKRANTKKVNKKYYQEQFVKIQNKTENWNFSSLFWTEVAIWHHFWIQLWWSVGRMDKSVPVEEIL